jgi:hypothetical protein
VVFVVLDAFPNSFVDPARTPTLSELAARGHRNSSGGVAQATAATYPNHATFVTGRSTLDHGIIANKVFSEGEWRPAAHVGPATPTLFDVCQAEGRRSALIVGDQNLIGVCGGVVADSHWPPYGEVPSGVTRSDAGYIVDDEVLAAVDAVGADGLDLLMVQLDEVDGVRHRHGAWGDEAEEQCHRTDAVLGSLVERLEPGWDDTVLFVVSDHDQEDVGRVDPVDLAGSVPDEVRSKVTAVVHQGTAALVLGTLDHGELLDLPGVVGAASLDDDHHVVWGGPGQTFGTSSVVGGDHGSPRTATQLALVAGGHPEADRIGRLMTAARPPATSWAGWAAEALGLRWRPGVELDPAGSRPGRR